MTQMALNTVRLMDCPYCGKPITARLSVEVTVNHAPGTADAYGKPDSMQLQLAPSTKITGMQVDHDCIPKSTRAGFDGSSLHPMGLSA